MKITGWIGKEEVEFFNNHYGKWGSGQDKQSPDIVIFRTRGPKDAWDEIDWPPVKVTLTLEPVPMRYAGEFDPGTRVTPTCVVDLYIDLLNEVRISAVEMSDPRIKYVTVQIDFDVWNAIQRLTPAVPSHTLPAPPAKSRRR